ncbi:MAG: heme-copper oxidase subunit III [Phycisphaerales bacterium]|jgi:cytochrome c oxidase subunit 3/cytochrome o ubiquinol oxidase subunit 3|nr:heme-copper oxidase subunit III [Phycisphaerales bacterium]
MTTAPTTPLTPPPALAQDGLMNGKVGVLLMIASDIAFFGTLITAYLFYIGRDINGPYPQDVLDVSIAPFKVLFNSVFLLISSVWIVLAIKAMRKGKMGAFIFWWALTVACGAEFLLGTGMEWYGLIVNDGVWMGTNLFGSCFYTLVGFHAFHVTMGLIVLTLILVLALLGKVHPRNVEKVDLVSWYWHFVDGIWIAVFFVVYIFGNWPVQ